MQQLGCNLTVIGPGMRAFPFHNHRVNEELFIILEGSEEVRIGSARHPLRPGDIVACPAGGPSHAHQIVNTGTTEMRYLAIATSRSPEVAEFPDSGKYAVIVRDAQGDGSQELGMRTVGRLGKQVDYWEGE